MLEICVRGLALTAPDHPEGRLEGHTEVRSAFWSN